MTFRLSKLHVLPCPSRCAFVSPCCNQRLVTASGILSVVHQKPDGDHLKLRNAYRGSMRVNLVL